jgi:hypothetical protein
MIVTSCYHQNVKTKTMVYLEPEQHRALKARARAEGISLAELVRRLAQDHVARAAVHRAVAPDTYSRLVALGASGRRTIGDDHDAHLARALKAKHAR